MSTQNATHGTEKRCVCVCAHLHSLLSFDASYTVHLLLHLSCHPSHLRLLHIPCPLPLYKHSAMETDIRIDRHTILYIIRYTVQHTNSFQKSFKSPLALTIMKCLNIVYIICLTCTKEYSHIQYTSQYMLLVKV